MQTLTQITLADELAIQGLSHTTIATHLGRHRETIGFWLKGGAADGLAGFLARYAQAKKGPRRARQVPATIKRLIWALRIREPECCGQKIAYFLEREHQIRLSVPKIYEILAEQYVIRSKWRKNQKRGAVPTASGPRVVIQMDTVALGGVFAFTGIDIYTKEAAVMLRPALTSEDGAVFLQTAMAHRFTGRVAVLQTDGGPEFRAPLPNRPAPIVIGIALPDRTRRTSRPIWKASTDAAQGRLRLGNLSRGGSTPLDSGGAHVSRPVSLPPAALGIGTHATSAHRAISPGGPTVGYLRKNNAESTIISSRGNQLDLSTWMAMFRLFGTAPDHFLLDVVHIIFIKT